MVELEFICDACSTRIADGDGVVEMPFSDIRDAQRLLRDRENSARASISVGNLLALPPPMRWRILHLVCRPQDGDTYEIDVDQLRTLPDLDRWTDHLRAKNWFHLTDWDELFAGVSTGRGDRIAVKQPDGGTT